MEEILMNAELEMENAISNLEKRFTNIRAGRANPAILDGVMVSYYGSMTPINQLSSITIPEPRQLLIKPYDRNDLKSIVAAINAYGCHVV